MNLESFLVSPLPQLIYSTYKNTPPRQHLGASIIGKECLRELWYDFRWAKKPDFDGRLLRLFEAGNAFEDRVVRELESIGIVVMNRQLIIPSVISPHFGGSIDGTGDGFPESKKTHLLEFKTHNQKSFDTLTSDGVQKAKPQHYVQMNVYMGALKLDRAYYIAENKNTSELYAERVKYDADVFYNAKMKAREIIYSPEPCARVSENPAVFACRFCNYKLMCHGAESMDKNCRTCRNVTVTDDGFLCAIHGIVPVEFQAVGCLDKYESI